MINRVLIRIKVVQMLYSYLLTEKHFTIEPQPSQPTKEKRFAYKVYIDTLALIVEIAKTARVSSKHINNRFTDALTSVEQLQAVLSKPSRGEIFEFREILEDLQKEITSSGVYKLYVKNSKGDSLIADVKVWMDLFENVIYKSELYKTVVSQYENYSLRGLERMKELMSCTFKNFMTSHGTLSDALVQLQKSLNAARELYFRMLLLPVAFADWRLQKIEEGRNKMLPTAEDLNPDFRLTEAPLLDLIRENTTIQEYAAATSIDWIGESPELINSLLKTIMESNAYADYKLKEPSVEADYSFWRAVFTDIICGNEVFLEEMENRSVFWNDDIDIITEFVIKTLRRFEEGMGQNAVMSMYKDDVDAQFARQLFSAVIVNKQKYHAVINQCLDTKLWESERLAYMDVIIILTAIAEMLNFPSIPLKVTLNEYIEIAKAYSTSKSGIFVNGLLGVIIAHLRREGILLKTDVTQK